MSIDDRINEAHKALSRGDVVGAARAMFSDAQLRAAMKCSAEELEEWALSEQNEGYGLRAEILERLAEIKRR